MGKYVPALSVGHLSIKGKPTVNGKTLDFWTNNSLIKPDKLLITYWYGRRYENFRKHFNMPDDITLIGDSGGFEILSHQSKGEPIFIDPIDVVKWQENNCNVGIILDIPPITLIGGSRTSIKVDDMKTLKEKAKTTNQNGKIMQANRTKFKEDGFMLYNVLQGGTLERINIWYDEVKDMGVDGWCIAPKPSSDPLNSALMLCYLHSKGITENIHILGVTGFNVTPLISYCKDMFKNVTYDSIAYIHGMVTRAMRMPLDPRQNIFMGRKSTGKINKICTCEVCNNVDIKEFYNEKTIGGWYITLHNLLMYKKYNEFANGLAEHKEEFKNIFFKFLSNDRFKQAIRFIDCYKQHGLEHACKQYIYKNTSLNSFITVDKDKEPDLQSIYEEFGDITKETALKLYEQRK